MENLHLVNCESVRGVQWKSLSIMSSISTGQSGIKINFPLLPLSSGHEFNGSNYDDGFGL